MNTYAIMLILGKIVLSIGPWPSMADCRSSLPAQEARITEAWSNPANVAAFRKSLGPNVRRQDIKLQCVLSATRPPLAKGEVR